MIINRIMPYALYGYPSVAESLDLIKHYLETGAKWIEIGFPYSDPVADGPVLQLAHEQALRQASEIGSPLMFIDLAHALKPLKKRYPHVQFVIMTYMNPIIVGQINTLLEAFKSLESIWVVPDLSLDHYDHYEPLFNKWGAQLAPIVSVHTNRERLSAYLSRPRPFIYLMSKDGTTGGASGKVDQLIDQIREIRLRSDAPIFVGFGIKTIQDVTDYLACVEGVVIATALIESYTKGNTRPLKAFLS